MNKNIKALLLALIITTTALVYAGCFNMTPKNYTVHFNSMAGSVVQSDTVKGSNKVEKPNDPTRAGYVFQGWYKENTFENRWMFDDHKVTENVTLYAKWVEEYEVSGLNLLFNPALSQLEFEFMLNRDFDLDVETNNIKISYYTLNEQEESVPIVNTVTEEPLIKDKGWAGFLWGNGTKHVKGTPSAPDYNDNYSNLLLKDTKYATGLRNGMASDNTSMDYHGIDWSEQYHFRVVLKLETEDVIFSFEKTFEHNMENGGEPEGEQLRARNIVANQPSQNLNNNNNTSMQNQNATTRDRENNNNTIVRNNSNDTNNQTRSQNTRNVQNLFRNRLSQNSNQTTQNTRQGMLTNNNKTVNNQANR